LAEKLGSAPLAPWLPRLKRIGQRRFNSCRYSIGQLRETQPARSTARQLLKNNGKLRTLAAAPSLFHDMTDTWLEMLVTPVPLARRPPATRFTGFCVSLDASASLPHCPTTSTCQALLFRELPLQFEPCFRDFSFPRGIEVCRGADGFRVAQKERPLRLIRHLPFPCLFPRVLVLSR
jgi:hypothetical protein